MSDSTAVQRRSKNRFAHWRVHRGHVAGRLFDVELDVEDGAEAERIGREAADRVLANGLIEGFEVVVEGQASEPLEAVAE
jgi:phosphoribosylformylglycinamidine (FGAM) synthase PurS component